MHLSFQSVPIVYKLSYPLIYTSTYIECS